MDRYEGQPADWADPPEPDPDMIADLWADRPPNGWTCDNCHKECEANENCECGNETLQS